MNEEQKEENETPEETEEKPAPEEPHEWNIEEFSQDIIEQRPPNEKILKFNIPEEVAEENSEEKEPSKPSEPKEDLDAPDAPDAPEKKSESE
jgi:hypothetical protein